MPVRNRRHFIVLAAAVAVVGVNTPIFADDMDYVGGPWNLGSSWSTGNVPTEYDNVRLTSDHTGSVQLNGGGAAGSIEFGNNSSGYQIIGEPTALLRTGHISNNGDMTNTISAFQLTGLQIDAETSQLVIDGNHLNVNSTIVDDDDRALDLWMAATLRNTALNSGATHLIGGDTTLIDNGQIALSPTIDVEKARLYLDNTGSRALGSRLSNNAALSLYASAIYDTGSNGSGNIDREQVASINLKTGGSLVVMRGGSSIYAFGASSRLTRDSTARGTMVLDLDQGTKFIAAPDGMVDDVVPYIVTRRTPGVFLPATYDNGADGIRGNADDGGLQPVSTFGFPGGFATTSHVFASTDYTLTSDREARTWTSFGGAKINLNGNHLTLDDGVLIIAGGGSGASASVTGTGNSQIGAASGREFFIYTDTTNTEIAARIVGNNGITLTSFDQSLWSGSRFILSGSNAYNGPTTVNGGVLVLPTAQSLPGASVLKLVESSFELNYTPTVPVANRIILDTGATTPTGSGSIIRTLEFQPGQTFSFTGSIEGRGAFFLHGDGATMKIDTTSAVSATTAGEYSLWPQEGCTLRVDGQLGDGTTSFGSAILFGGTLVGKGRLTGGVQLSSGVLAPGSNGAAGTAVMRVRDAGFYGGEAHFNINGTTRGTQYDGVDVDNGMVTGSDVKFVIEGGSFVGQIGQRFDLVKYASHYELGLPMVSVGLATQVGGQWVHYYTANSFTLAVAGPTGDTNLDGKVNFADLVTLAQNYNHSGTNWLTADFNYDGVTNFSDLVALAQHYNQTVLPGSLTADTAFASDWALAQSFVPEPTTASLVIGLGTLAARRRRS